MNVHLKYITHATMKQGLYAQTQLGALHAHVDLDTLGMELTAQVGYVYNK